MKAVFLDRDGTINVDNGNFHDPNKLIFVENAKEGLIELSKNHILIVISNQAGIGYRLHTSQDTDNVNKRISEELFNIGVEIKKFYYCPHTREDDCKCRKPGSKLFLEAAKEFDIDLNKSWFIGDKTSDIKSVENLKPDYPGFRSILVLTGDAGKDKKFEIIPDYTSKDLKEVSNIISNHTSN